MNEFSHLDDKGRAKMVDVGHKPAQVRVAVAEGFVRCLAKTVAALRAKSFGFGISQIPAVTCWRPPGWPAFRRPSARMS